MTGLVIGILLVGLAAMIAVYALREMRQPQPVETLNIYISGEVDVFSVAAAVQAAKVGAISA